MKKIIYLIILSFMFQSQCSSAQSVDQEQIQESMELAEDQNRHMFEVMSQRKEEVNDGKAVADGEDLVSPRSIDPDGTLHLVPSSDWTSGFFPGELWYLYEYTDDDTWMEHAKRITEQLEQEKMNDGTHDMGFKIYNSFGHGYRLTDNESYKKIIIESAQTLTTRYNPTVGSIRSWDFNKEVWDFPVIIDNMMNLELLFAATELSGDSTYYNIAVDHANTTMKNHFRDDGSSYHVIDYNPETGEIRKRNTHQGYSDESGWTRGQAWGLYGFTMSYRETKMEEYMEQAETIADYILEHPNLPDDLVPYWDFNAPGIPDEPRDASAAAITASALYELSTYSDRGDYYRQKADAMLQSLVKNYTAEVGTNKGFLLKHSTGNKAGDSEVDVPLVYADYYYIEALMRKESLLDNGKIEI
jgi:rhamnogalacturonyl hydrolase YesR